jgi:PTH1 family peptidyl-tRNA hydrolase
MYLIVGLGNPGKKYEKTRHNIGFRIIDEIAANFQFSPAPTKGGGGVQSIFNAKISKGEIANKEIVLAKPQTFMNNSGKAVKSLIKNLKLEIRNLIIIHDDIDLPLGKIRIVKNRGSAGHKGVESIIRELKTKDFVRFRIGINQFAQNQKSKIKNQKLDEFVLKKFSKGEEKIVKEVIKKTVEAIEFSLKEGLEKAMTKINR